MPNIDPLVLFKQAKGVRLLPATAMHLNAGKEDADDDEADEAC